MNKIQAKRFKKLIAFLEELPREKFNFGEVINPCGTVGCAMGWTPKVFPKLVKWKNILRRFITVKSIKGTAEDYYQVAAELFGIDEDEAELLFTPECQWYLNLQDLPTTATPKQVAKMLKKYLKLKHPEHA